MIKVISASLLVFVSVSLLAQSEKSFVLIQPVDDGKGEMPLMELVPDTANIYKVSQKALEESFIGQAIQLYHFAQNYLINTGQVSAREPAYLAITKNQGGFAKKGFQIKTLEGTINKSNAYYVDLTANSITSKLDRLMSVSQLYPHELGHVIFRLLSSTDSIEHQAKSVTVHYFSLMTDNSVAFNEGFAEHIENISRIYERNETIRKGIENDVAVREPNLLRASESFVRDFNWPLRLDYYKCTMLVWFQQYEDYKRYKHSLEGTVTFQNGYPSLSSVQDMMSVRNAGVIQLDKKRNKAQLMSSEGFVSAFFSRLAVNGLGKYYRNEKFYSNFLKDTAGVMDPVQKFNEVENLFLKYFHVLNKHVRLEQSDRAQLMDFIEGYMEEFHDESEIILSTYQELSGEAYSPDYPPAIWLMVKNYNHRILALDALGAITLPVYTFNLNAAQGVDLLSVPGMDGQSAAELIRYRDEIGPFQSLNQVLELSHVTEEAKKGLRNSEFDEAYLEGMDEETLDIGPLLRTPLFHLLKTGTIAYLIIFSATFLLLLRNTSKGLNALLTFIKYYFIWILLLVAGLAALVVQGNPILLFLPIMVVYYIFGYLILRKKYRSLKHFILISFLMHLVIIYSLI